MGAARAPRRRLRSVSSSRYRRLALILDQHGQVQNHTRPVAIDRLDAGYRQILAPTANEAASMPCDRGLFARRARDSSDALAEQVINPRHVGRVLDQALWI